MAKHIDLTGQKFGRLTPVRKIPPIRGQSMWECRCDCGAVTTVRTDHMRGGRSTSCGCYSKEMRTKHGMSKTTEYRCWQHMKERCFKPDHPEAKNYGGRGITVCPQWISSFETFIEDMGPRPDGAYSIDRRDNDGDYTPDNCRWADPMQQIYNRRNTRFATIDGVTLPVKHWCQRTGIPYKTALRRIHRGVPPEVAVTVKGHGLRGTRHHQ